MKKIWEFIKNIFFWLKTNFIVKPTKWIDSKTKPEFGYQAYLWSKKLSKIFIWFVFPVTAITFACAAATTTGDPWKGGAGIVIDDSGVMFLTSMWITVSVLITTSILLVSWWWFSKFQPVTTEEVKEAKHEIVEQNQEVKKSTKKSTKKKSTKKGGKK